uniref:hypothetical protein n=1 Tax=Candidatus Magnetaquicoccus inordinatus TaxID=2496818 RepID=UPI00102BB564
MDRRTTLALTLALLLLMVYQTYMSIRFPEQGQQTEQSTSKPEATTTPTAEAKVPDGKGTPVSNVQVG